MKFLPNISIEELQTIERYLTGSMTEAEKQVFMEQLSSDETLQHKIREVQTLLLGIQEDGLREKMAAIHAAHFQSSEKKAKIFPMRRMMLAASVLIVAIIGIWLLDPFGNKSKKIYSKYYSPDPGLPTVMSASLDYDFQKAMVEYKNGNYVAALSAWQTLLQAKPGNDTLLYFIAAAKQAQGQAEDAITSLKAIADNPLSAFQKDACWYLGLCYLKVGDTKNATTYFQRSGHPQAAPVIEAIK